jgi:cell division protein FtsZ
LEQKIKIIGVGGGGCNVIKHLLKKPGPGCQHLACNTDIRSLDSVPGDVLSVQLGEHYTRGFGAGGDIRVGEKSADEARFLLKRAIRSTPDPAGVNVPRGTTMPDFIFIIAGLGGGTGTGAAPIVAEIAREACPGALVIGVVCTPFAFEGKRRSQVSLGGIRNLRPHVDNLVIIDCDAVLGYDTGRPNTQHAFREADAAMAEAINLVVDLVNVPGELNVDPRDVALVMRSLGGTLMLTGHGQTAEQAVETAAHLLDLDLSSARALLFNFKGGPDMTLGHVNDAADLIAAKVDPSAIMFFGMSKPSEVLHEVHFTLLATGIEPELPETWMAK